MSVGKKKLSNFCLPHQKIPVKDPTSIKTVQCIHSSKVSDKAVSSILQTCSILVRSYWTAEIYSIWQFLASDLIIADSLLTVQLNVTLQASNISE